jgi:hypothetical protein
MNGGCRLRPYRVVRRIGGFGHHPKHPAAPTNHLPVNGRRGLSSLHQLRALQNGSGVDVFPFVALPALAGAVLSWILRDLERHGWTTAVSGTAIMAGTLLVSI